LISDYSRKNRIGDLQEEFLVPDGIEFLGNSLGAFLGLSDLNRDVRVAGSGFVFADQALSADHCKTTPTAMHACLTL